MDFCKKWIDKLSLGMCMNELMVYSKWIYRHRNQQRRHKVFQRIVQIEKKIKKYHQIDVMNTARETLLQCFNCLDGGKLKLVEEFLSHIVNDVIYVTQLLDLMESTLYQLYQRIMTNHLLYSYLLISASLSRLWFHMRIHIWGLTQLHLSVHQMFVKSHFNWRDVLSDDYIRYLPLAISSKTYNDRKKSQLIKVNPELEALREHDFKLTTQKSDRILVNLKTKAKRRHTANTIRLMMKGKIIQLRGNKLVKYIRNNRADLVISKLILIKRKPFRYYSVRRIRLHQRLNRRCLKQQTAASSKISYQDTNIIDELFKPLEINRHGDSDPLIQQLKF